MATKKATKKVSAKTSTAKATTKKKATISKPVAAKVLASKPKTSTVETTTVTTTRKNFLKDINHENFRQALNQPSPVTLGILSGLLSVAAIAGMTYLISNAFEKVYGPNAIASTYVVPVLYVSAILIIALLGFVAPLVYGFRKGARAGGLYIVGEVATLLVLMVTLPLAVDLFSNDPAPINGDICGSSMSQQNPGYAESCSLNGAPTTPTTPTTPAMQMNDTPATDTAPATY